MIGKPSFRLAIRSASLPVPSEPASLAEVQLFGFIRSELTAADITFAPPEPSDAIQYRPFAVTT